MSRAPTIYQSSGINNSRAAAAGGLERARGGNNISDSALINLKKQVSRDACYY
jgi:hypothetical protein